MNKKVAILIVTYNGSEYIGDCLSSLEDITYPSHLYQIIVIDNASTDDTVSIAQNYDNVHVIQNAENLGFVGGNNLGLQYAMQHNFDYAFLLNQDTEVTPEFIDEVVSVAEEDAMIAAVQSKLLLYDSPNQINSTGNQIHYLGFGYAGGHKTQDQKIEKQEIAYPSGAAVLLQLAALQDVGLFNEEFFMYHEDLDLGWRLWLGGYRVIVAPTSIVYHKYQFSESIKKFYYMERNRYLVVAQNYRIGTFLLLLPMFAVMELAMLIFSIRSGWFKELMKMYRYFLSVEHLKKMAIAREAVQKNRRVPDRQVIKRFTSVIAFQDLDNVVLRVIGNPLMKAYWGIVRRFIFW